MGLVALGLEVTVMELAVKGTSLPGGPYCKHAKTKGFLFLQVSGPPGICPHSLASLLRF